MKEISDPKRSRGKTTRRPRILLLEQLERRVLLDALVSDSASAPLNATGPTMLPDALTRPVDTTGDAALTGALDPNANPPSGLRPYGATASDTSEFMLGSVYLTVVLLESDGSIDTSTENWSAPRITQVKNEIQEGTDWWEATLAAQGVSHSLDFTINWTYADTPFQTGYEAINRTSSSDWLWINDFLGDQGYATGINRMDTLTKFDTYNDAQRLANNTDWAFTVFVADSNNDADNKFPDGRFAYAWLGGPYVQMTYGNDGWGIGDMGKVFAHESGHIFYALDEYPGSGTYYERSGYYNTQNVNAYDSNPSPGSRVISLMGEQALQDPAYLNHTSSPASLAMIGWQDSDHDGIYDVLDRPMTLTGSGSYNQISHVYSFGGTSAVQVLNNLNPNGSAHDITTNTIDHIQYKVDSGSWIDGNAYHFYSGSVAQNVSVTSGGSHTIYFRTIVDDSGLTSAVWQDTFNVESSSVQVALRVASDTGVDDQDHITKDNTPTYDVTVSGAGMIAVDWYGNGSLVDSQPVGSGGTYQMTPSVALTDGMRPVDVTFTASGGVVATDSDPTTIDTLAPTAPSIPDLQTGSDTGVSTSDNLTLDNTPTLSLSGFSGNYYRLKRGGVQISTDYATTSSFTDGALSDGTYNYVLYAVDAAGNVSGGSSALAVTVDRTAPTVSDLTPNTVQYASVTQLVVTFSDTNAMWESTVTSKPNYVLLNSGGDGIFGNGNDVNVSSLIDTVGYASGPKQATLTLTGPLPDETYRVTVNGTTSVKDAAGNSLGGGVDYAASFEVNVVPDVSVHLQTGSDTGSSNSDHITNDTTPTYDVTVDGPGTIDIDWNNDSTVDLTDAVGAAGTYQYTPTAPLSGSPATLYDIKVTYTNPAAADVSATDPTTIDTVAPAAPTGLDLLAASDSGQSSSDNITSFTSLSFDFTNAGDFFRFYRNTTLLTLTDETGTSYTATSQPEGSWNYAVSAVDVAGNESAKSAALPVMIDTSAPAAPSTPDLRQTSDSGMSDADNITNDPNPNLDFSGFGSYYRLWRNGVQLGGDYETAATLAEGPLADGSYSYVLFAVDVAGNVSLGSAALPLIIDTVGPTLASATPTDGGTSGSELSRIILTFGDSNVLWASTLSDKNNYALSDGGDISGRITGATYTSGPKRVVLDLSPVLGDGNYQLTIDGTSSVRDAAGNKLNNGADEVVSFTVDVVPTVAVRLQAGSDTGISQTDNLTNDATPTFDVTINGSGTITIDWEGDGPIDVTYAAGSAGAYSFTAPTLSDGAYPVNVTYTYSPLKHATGSDPTTIDTQGPAQPGGLDLRPTSDSGISSSDDITSDLTPSFNVSATPYYRIDRDGTAVTTGYDTASVVTLATQPEGTFDFQVVALDAAGNASVPSDPLSVTIDATKPSVPAIPDLAAGSDSGMSDTDNLTNDTLPTLNIGGFGDYYRLYRNGALVGTEYESAPTFYDTLAGDGTYSYVAYAVDAAGNVSGKSAALLVTLDTAGPTVVSTDPSGVVRTVLSSMAVTFADDNALWEATVKDKSNYQLLASGMDGTFGDGNEVDESSMISSIFYSSAGKRATLGFSPGLLDEAWLLSVSGTSSVRDAAGNPLNDGADKSVAFWVNTQGLSVVVDLQAESDSGLSDTDNITNDTTPTYNVYVFEPGTITIDWDGNGTVDATRNAPTFGIYPMTPTSAFTNGTYPVRVTFTDTMSNSVTRTSPTTIDTAGPGAPSAPDLATASDTGVSGTDNITQDSTPTFGVTAGAYWRLKRNGATISGNYETGTAYALDFQPDGTYQYTLVNVDVAGNESAASAPLSVMIDTAAPATPAAPDLQAGSDTGVSDTDNVTMDVTPTFDVTAGPYYRFKRDGVLLSDTYQTGATFTLTTQPDNTYDYTVTAVDVAGNESALSDATTVTIDTVAPVKPAAPDLHPGSDTGISQTDDLTNDLTPTFSIPAGLYFRVQRAGETISGPFEFGETWMLPEQTEGTLAYTLIALDAAGNASPQSDPLSVTYDVTPPAAPQAPDLQAASDSGISDTDDLTNDAAPVFDVSGFGDYFQMRRNGILASAQMQTWSTFTDDLFVDDSYAYVLYSVDAAGNVSAGSDALDVIFDKTGPTIASLIPAGVSPTVIGAIGVVLADANGLWSETIPAVANFGLRRGGGDRGFTQGNEEDLSALITDVAYTPDTATLAFSSDLTDEYYQVYVPGGNTIRDLAGNVFSAGAGDTADVTVDAVAPAVTVDLQAASDTGASDSDNITKTTIPIFDVTVNQPGLIAIDWDGDALADVTETVGAAGTYTFSPQGPLADGVYPVQVTFTDTALNVATDADPTTIDTVAPAPALTPVLTAASDTGISDSDRLTNDKTPTLTIGGFGEYYRIERNDVQVSGDFESSAAFTDTISADGVYGYETLAVDAAGNVADGSATLAVTLDATAPVVSATTPARNAVLTVFPTFADVTFLEAEALTVATALDPANYALAGDYVGAITLAGVTSEGGNTYRLAFDTDRPDDSLPFDNYTLTLRGATSIEDDAGNHLDGNGDGVGGDDYVQRFGLIERVGELSEGGVTVSVYDTAAPMDVDLADVSVKFGSGSVSSITLGGTQAMDGLGLAISGASSVGSVKDSRKGVYGDVSFIAADAPIGTVTLKSRLTGSNLNGLTLGGLTFATDVDGDGGTSDPVGLWVGDAQGSDTGLKLLKLQQPVSGDIVVDAGLKSVSLKGGDLGGDVRVGGELKSLNVKDGDVLGDVSAGIISKINVKNGGLDGDVSGASVGKISVSGGGLGGAVTALSGSVDNVSIKGGDIDGDIAGVTINKISLKDGDLNGDLNASGADAKGYGINSLSVSNGNVTGNLLAAAGEINKVSVKGAGGSLIGNISTQAALNSLKADAVAGALVNARSITKVTVKYDMTDTIMLAGYLFGDDFAYGGGDDEHLSGGIDSVSIKGQMRDSSLAAAVSPGPLGLFGDDDDAADGHVGGIAKVTINGGTVNSGGAYGIVAASDQISYKIGPDKGTVVSGNSLIVGGITLAVLD